MNVSNGAGPFVWACILVATCLLLVIFQQVLWLIIPAMFAIILYYLLQPAVQHLTFLGFPHRRAVGIVMGGLLLVLITAVVSLTPLILGKLANWPTGSSRYVGAGEKLITRSFSSLETKLPFLRGAGLTENVNHWMDENSTRFAEKYLGAIVFILLEWTPSLLLVPYITYFLLADSARLKKFFLAAVPNAFFEKTLLLSYRLGAQVRSYFQGLMALTLLDAVCLSFGLAMLGISSPVMLGIITSILAWIPYVGSILGCIIVILVAAADYPDSTWIAYGAVGVFIAVRMLDDFVFLPATIGRSLQIHPLITVIMIFVGGAVAGVAGLLLVMPVLGVVMVFGEIIGQVLTDERLKARHEHAVKLRRRRAREFIPTS